MKQSISKKNFQMRYVKKNGSTTQINFPSKQDEDLGTFSSKQLKITNNGQSQHMVNGITQASKAGRVGEEGRGRRERERER